MPYNLLSRRSLLMLLYHAIGDGGCKSDIGEMGLKFFLSYDCKYAPPSVIAREIERAKNLGLIEMKGAYQNIVFSEVGLKAIEEDGVDMGSFLNVKWRNARDLEARAAKMGNQTTAGPYAAKARQLHEEVSREGLFWFPEEWKEKTSKPGAPPSASNAVTIAGDLKITRPPPKPKKMTSS